MSLIFRVIGSVLLLVGSVGLVLANILDQVSLIVIFIIPIMVIKGPLGIISILPIVSGLIAFLEDLFSSERTTFGKGGRPGRNQGIRSQMDERSKTVRTEGIFFLGPLPIFIGGGGRNKDSLPWWALPMVGLIIILFFNIIMVIIVMMWSR
jgi:hypothetical protein